MRLRAERNVQVQMRDGIPPATDCWTPDGDLVPPLLVRTPSSAQDTDLTGTLVDVHPGGRAIGLADGILRMQHRDSASRRTLMGPNRTPVLAVIDR